jgi:hypothetical protein
VNNVKLNLFCVFISAIFVFFATSEVVGQNRKSVSGREVTGTFRSFYTGKFKGSYNEIKIEALGGGKLKVSFDLTYPYVVNKELSANLGSNSGTATIEGDTAVFKDEEFGQCTITLKFTKPGTLIVTQNGSDAECGFGRNVTADGTYKKTSSAKPKFESPEN